MNTDFLRHPAFLVGTGVVAGGVAGYFFANKKAKAKYLAIAEEEIESVKDTYHLLTGKGEYADDRTASDAYLERIDNLQYNSGGFNEDELQIKRQQDAMLEPKVVGDPDPEAEQEAEIERLRQRLGTSKPSDLEPNVKLEKVPDEFYGKTVDGDFYGEPGDDPNSAYLMSVDQFMMEEEDYAKITIVYYEGDDTLADEREQMIPDVENTVGVESLTHFGMNPGDPDVIHVRNPRIQADFEICRDPRGFSEVVLGIKTVDNVTITRVSDDE